MNASRLLLLPLVALGLAATPCSAAFLGANSSALLLDPDGFLIIGDLDQQNFFDTAIDGRVVSASATLSEQGAAMQSRATGNVGTGGFTSSAAKNGANGRAEASAGTFSNFVANSSGSVEFRFDLSGGWDVADTPPLDGDNRFYQEALLSFSDGASSNDGQYIVDSAFDADFNPPDFDPVGTTSQRLSYTAVVQAGSSYSIGTSIFSSLVGAAQGTGTLDGILSYVASSGVSLSFDDPEFLATPIPLPASGLLLLGGLGGFASLRAWRNRRQDQGIGAAALPAR